MRIVRLIATNRAFKFGLGTAVAAPFVFEDLFPYAAYPFALLLYGIYLPLNWMGLL